MTAPIERTTRIATSVDDLAAVWQFVMSHVDEVGPDPEIHVTPIWTITLDTDAAPRRFEVVVSGMVPEHTHERAEGAI